MVAWVWTYHRVYDDLLLLLPAFVLCCRPGEGWPEGKGRRADLFGAGLVLLLLVPAELRFGPAPWDLLFHLVQPLWWGLAAGFLGSLAARSSRPGSTSTP